MNDVFFVTLQNCICKCCKSKRKSLSGKHESTQKMSPLTHSTYKYYMSTLL